MTWRAMSANPDLGVDAAPVPAVPLVVRRAGWGLIVVGHRAGHRNAWRTDSADAVAAAEAANEIADDSEAAERALTRLNYSWLPSDPTARVE